MQPARERLSSKNASQALQRACQAFVSFGQFRIAVAQCRIGFVLGRFANALGLGTIPVGTAFLAHADGAACNSSAVVIAMAHHTIAESMSPCSLAVSARSIRSPIARRPRMRA